MPLTVEKWRDQTTSQFFQPSCLEFALLLVQGAQLAISRFFNNRELTRHANRLIDHLQFSLKTTNIFRQCIGDSVTVGSSSENNTETELRALEKSFSDAIVSSDASAVEQFLATDWVIIDPDGGVIDRSRFLDVIRSGALKHDSMESEDFRIRVYGDTAIVTALTSTKGAFMGQVFATKERATDVFVKRDGR